jgi:hypothetical protein
MTVDARTKNGAALDNPLLSLFAHSEGFWRPYLSHARPYLSFARALLDTQKALIDIQMSTFAYFEANRKLMEEIQNILKDLDPSLQISRKLLEGVAEKKPVLEESENEPPVEEGAERKASVIPGSDMHAIFDSAIASWQELREAWADAQMRSLDAICSRAPGAGKRRERQRPAIKE